MTIEEFNNLVKSNKLTICKLGAEWCAPCKVLEQNIESLKAKMPDVNFIMIDVEDEPEIATHLRIRNVPVLLYYKDGELKDKTVGLVSEQTIKEKVESLKA
jgi:thioredoxin 1